MQKMIHNVLGTPYEVVLGDREDIQIKEEYSGECRVFSKQIKVCTEKEDCTEEELRVKTREVVAHEFFHAYLNEAGVDLEEHVEESLATFYMKNWEKMSNSILEVLDKSGFLDK